MQPSSESFGRAFDSESAAPPTSLSPITTEPALKVFDVFEVVLENAAYVIPQPANATSESTTRQRRALRVRLMSAPPPLGLELRAQVHDAAAMRVAGGHQLGGHV